MPELLPARRSNKTPHPPDYTLMWRAPDGTLYDWNNEERPAGCVMFFHKIKDSAPREVFWEDKDAKRP